MTRALKARLQRLEHRISSDPKNSLDAWWHSHVLYYVIGCYVGGPAPNGVQELTGDAFQLAHDAYRRALGYSDPHEFEKHQRTHDPELQRRHQEALDKLLLQFGVDKDGKGMYAALQRMEDEFPEPYKECFHFPFCVL